MKNFNKILALILLSAATLSCNKKGCSDPTADNYLNGVKKAKDNRCQYNGEGICGKDISFCFNLNGTKITEGKAKFYASAPGSQNKTIIWTNGLSETNPNYKDIILFIYGNKENGTYDYANTSANLTFRAEYYDGQTSSVSYGSSGSLSIKKDNSSDGLIATFNFTTQNGLQIKNGNVYRLK